ncbi:MAG: M4 family metallopeptidase [Chitinophagales bacterium]|nr:M4 family metallopeptidase [Chitinophagales bacterium]
MMRIYCTITLALLFCLTLPAQTISLNAFTTPESTADWLIFKPNTPLTAQSFLDRQKDFLALPANNGLKLVRTKTDKLGFTHYRYQQTYRQLPVEGAEFLLHEKDNQLKSTNSGLVNGLNISITPTLTEIDALENALIATKANRFAWQNADMENMLRYATNKPDATFYPSGQLVLVSSRFDRNAKNFKLAYKFDIYTDVPQSHDIYYIDAHTGEEIIRINQSPMCDGEQSCSAQSLYNGVVNIGTYNSGTNYNLRNCEAGGGIETFNAANANSFAANWVNSNDCAFENDPTAISAHWAAESTFNYFEQYQNCSSFDDNNAKILSWVHYGNQYNNAQWNGLWMLYGDGDPLLYNPFVSLDIVAHEITHAYTQHSANLVYAYEAGALNESFSDIFGVVVDYYTTGNLNWEIGEQVNVNGQGFRSMSNPKQYHSPTTYGGEYWVDPIDCFAWSMSDYCGVHVNSGIQNYWFYLLVNGGTITNDNGDVYSLDGIGIDRAAQIAYQMLQYLPANASYMDAKSASTVIAQNLWGTVSSEYAAVRTAWCAVGVGTCDNQTIALTTPGAQANEQYQGGQIKTINWLGQINAPTVALTYSIDNGLSWQYINPAAPNTGTYNWLLPNVNTNNAIVRVQSTQNEGLIATSVHPFQITGCGTTAYFKISDTPSSVIPDICQFENLAFTNTSTGATNYEWYINEQLVSSTTNFSYTFSNTLNTNWQTVTLVAHYNNDCTDQFTRYIYVNPQPNAQFSYINNDANQVQFYAAQNQLNMQYSWSFGDGTNSIEETPNHTYTNAGTYEVCLNVISICNVDNQCKTITIAPLITQTDVCAGTWVNYTLTRDIKALLQQNDSLMWIATSGGLVKYNTQTNTKQVFTSANNLSGNSITALALKNNALWFATNIGGIGKYENNTFYSYTLPNNLNPNNELSGLQINDLKIDNNGNIWLAIYNHGLIKFDGDNNWQQYTDTNSNLVNTNIEKIYFDTAGNLWCIANSANVTDHASLSKMTTDGVFTHYLFDGSSLPAAQSVRDLVIDQHNNKWLLVSYPNQKSVIVFDENTLTFNTERQGNITALAPNNLGYVSIASINDPLYHYNGNTWTVQIENMQYPSIIYYDSQQTLWLGGEKLSRNLTATNEWTDLNISNPNTLPNGLINDTYTNSHYQAAFATSNGVWCYQNGTFTNNISTNASSALTGDDTGNLWFVKNVANSNFAGQFVKYTPDNIANNNDLTTYPITLPNLIISKIVLNANGIIWAAAKENGLLRFDTATGEQQLYPLNTINNTNNGIGISSLALDFQGNLWVGGSNGIAKFDGSQWQYFTADNGYLNNFTPVNDLVFAPDGTLWIATLNGLVKFDGNNWQYYTTQNSGLCNNNINKISADAYGNLYVLTQNGISYLNKQENWETLTAYNSGLPNNNINGLTIDHQGNAFFASNNGIGILQNNTGIIPDFTPTIEKICNPQSVSFNNTSVVNTQSTTYKWLVDGQEVSADQQLVYQFTTAGKHMVALIADNGTCQNSISKAIQVYPNANDLYIAPQIISCGTNSVLLDANIDKMASYNWLFNGYQIGTVRALEVSQIGTYTVIVTDECGSTASAAVAVSLDNDCVFPGDANYDGICNNYDVLAVARAFDLQGNARDIQSMQWDSWFSSDWNSFATDGTNFKHADTDGNGIVNRNDLQAIELNYGLTHIDNTPTPTLNNSPLTILPEGGSFEFNNGTISIDLSLANIIAPNSMVNGRAFAASIELAITNAVGQPLSAVRVDSARVRFGTEFGNDQNSWSISHFHSSSLNRGIVDIGYLHTGGDFDLAGRKAVLDVYIEDEDSFPSIDSVLLAININYGAILNGNQLLPMGQYAAAILPPGNTTIVQAKALLQGPYNPQTDNMSTTLRTVNLLPVAQPYNRLPWNYAGVENIATTDNIPTDAVDWILLEMRDATGTTIVEQKAAFLLKDGRVVDTYGFSTNGVRFQHLQNGSLYRLIVRHRNHLAIMSAPIMVSNGTWEYDFTLMATQAVDGKQVSLGNGRYGMYAGDFNANGVISVSDNARYINQASILNQYIDADCNFDRMVSVKDMNLYLPNASQIGVPEVRY